MALFVLLAGIGLFFFVFFLSMWLTTFFRRAAFQHQWLDIPNSRSSHDIPVPRGAGIVFAGIILAAIVVLSGNMLFTRAGIALVGSCGLMAAVGFWDDLRGLSWKSRFLVQALAALWGIVWAGGLTVLPLGHLLIPVGWFGLPFGIIAVMWLCNLYNFMDGIDGLAASQAIFVSLGFALLGWLAGPVGFIPLGIIVAAACAGFLVWNWSPAKVFMGDTGATFLGIMFGLWLVIAANDKTLSAWACLILMGLFVTDATVTLTRRALRREQLTQPHRTHAFQHVALRWGHPATVLTYMVVNVFWLLPWAVVAQMQPVWAPVYALAAIIPLIVAVVYIGAGRN